jgi:hypothetical protein
MTSIIIVVYTAAAAVGKTADFNSNESEWFYF